MYKYRPCFSLVISSRNATYLPNNFDISIRIKWKPTLLNNMEIHQRLLLLFSSLALNSWQARKWALATRCPQTVLRIEIQARAEVLIHMECAKWKRLRKLLQKHCFLYLRKMICKNLNSLVVKSPLASCFGSDDWWRTLLTPYNDSASRWSLLS